MSEQQVIERVWQAPLELVWKLWTTTDGIASWFGPQGFTGEVEEIELRAGGAFRYTMSATDPEKVAMMEKQGRPASWAVESTITEVDPPNKLADGPGDDDNRRRIPGRAGRREAGAHHLGDEGRHDGGAAMGWESSLQQFAEQLA